MSLSQEDKDDITAAFAQTLQQDRYVPEDQHCMDHDWAKAKRESEEARKEFWEAVKNKLIEQGVIRAFWLLVGLSILGAIAWFKGLVTWPGS